MRRFVVALAVLAAAVGVYAVAGWFVLPELARPRLERLLAAEFDRPVRIARLEFDPFALKAGVSGFEVGGRDPAGKALLRVGRIDADLAWRSLVERAPVIESLRVSDPGLRLARAADGRLDVDDLLQKWLAAPAKPDEPPPRFSVANFALRGGTVEFDDESARASHRVDQFDLAVPLVSTLAADRERDVEAKLSARVDGSAVALAGRGRPFGASRDAKFDVEVAPLDLTHYLSYLPELPVRIASLLFDGGARVEYAQPAGKAAQLAITGRAHFARIDVREPGGAPVVAASELTLESLSLHPLDDRYDVGRVVLDAPAFRVHRKRGGEYFFLTLIEAQAAQRKNAASRGAQAAGAAAPPGLRWSVGEVVVQRGSLDYLDERFEPKPLALKVASVSASAKGIDSALDKPIPVAIDAATDRGTRVQAEGSVTPSPLTIDAKAALSNLALKDWWWIAQPAVRADVVDGRLDASASVRVDTATGEAAVRLSGLAGEVRSLRLLQGWDRRELLRLASLRVEGVDADTAARRVRVASVKVAGGALSIERDGDGTLNLARLAASPSASSREEARAPRGDATRQRARRAGGDWSVRVEQSALRQFAVHLKDANAGREADLDVTKISFSARGLGTQRRQRATIALDAQVGQAGRIGARGTVALDPVAATLKVAAADVSILPLQPYFEPYVNVAVTSGRIELGGDLSIDASEATAPQVGWQGDVAISDFGAVNKVDNDDLLRWKSLRLNALGFKLRPLEVDVGDVALSDFFTRLFIRPDGRFNLQDVVVREGQQAGASRPAAPAGQPGGPTQQAAAPGQATPAPGPAAGEAPAAPAPGPAAGDGPAPQLRIGRISLANGNIDFSDFFVRPNYSANLTGVTGTIGAMTHESAGDVDLRARIDDGGSVEILGKFNPLSPQLFLDLNASARDIDLPRASPYSVRHLGYGIEKGKLSAKVHYRVQDRRLEAQNNVVLDQLTFGEKVDSPSATKLPVLFAVALLKDRNGVIDVNLPIGGSLDDPDFSVGGIVLKLVLNLIVKAVTAPFTLLGSLFAHGPELSYMDFAPGSVQVAPAAESRLESLAKALNDRPALKLEIAGRADRSQDGDALRRLTLDRAVKTQKLRSEARAGGAAGSVDAVTVDPSEYPKWLALAYRAGDFPKPRNFLGIVRDVPVPDMERAIMDHAAVDDEALRDLALHRAEAARNWLEARGGVAGSRLFVVAPRLGVEGLPQGASALRVDFSLR